MKKKAGKFQAASGARKEMMGIIKSDCSHTLPCSKAHCTTWFVKSHTPLEAIITLAIIRCMPYGANLLGELINQVCTLSFG